MDMIADFIHERKFKLILISDWVSLINLKIHYFCQHLILHKVRSCTRGNQEVIDQTRCVSAQPGTQNTTEHSCSSVTLPHLTVCNTGFSFKAGGRTFRPVVFHSMSGALISLLEGFFIILCL